jgi:hypothetical protein
MGKLLLSLSMLSLLILAVGTSLMPNNPVFWLATGDNFYQFARLALALVLGIQLVTHPPRHIALRIAAGMLAVTIGYWVIVETYASQMMWLDTLSLLSAAIATGITALELRPEDVSEEEYELPTRQTLPTA